MVTVNIASVLWIFLNTIGLIYGIRVSKKYRSAYRLVKGYDESDREAILFQAKQNKRLATTATGCIFVFWSAGIASLFVKPGDPTLIMAIQFALIAGDILAVMLVYFLDSGWDHLRAIVGGRRAEDRFRK